MTLDEAIRHAEEVAEYDCYNDDQRKCADEHRQLAEWLRELKRLRESATDTDTISRRAAVEAVNELTYPSSLVDVKRKLVELPSAQPDAEKYEYHYDHTDCIWYRPEARNRCPVTCAQYRDGWNDAMNYIFRDGNGYRPYRRGVQYEE